MCGKGLSGKRNPLYEAFVTNDGKITYTIQIGGQCPALLYNWKEEDILGLKTR